MAEIRLDKIISESGIASRRGANGLIKAGAVIVDGKPLKDGSVKLDPDKHVIVCGGQRLKPARFRYIMLNKPQGVLSATEDREQKTVIDLLPEELRRLGLFPVGRLDKDTTGLLLLTNDGGLAHKVTSPRHEVKKLYELHTEVSMEEGDELTIAAGIELRNGTKCRPAALKIDPDNSSHAFIEITEGKYHQVKRMLAALGKPVVKLKRCRVGALPLDESLQPGENRELKAEEVALLFTK